MQDFLRSQIAAGIVLLLATATALLWANSPAADAYHALWHTPLPVDIRWPWLAAPLALGALEFGVNDGLMTIFFLVVGLELRRELHDGVLADTRTAMLPLVAALGGVIAPVLIYLALNGADPVRRAGWAVPTATDIAFAVGVLALLGRRIAPGVRMLLLSLAVIDDIVAILIIALVYSGRIAPMGVLIATAGIGLVFLLRRFHIRSAWAYVPPGAVLWFGLLWCGIHPTLAGIALGLLTPVDVRRWGLPVIAGGVPQPPVERVRAALHPWVTFGVMPVFALANAGVDLRHLDLSNDGALWIAGGVGIALLMGKPLGIGLTCALAVKSGLCRLPPGADWRGILLVGVLSGIGFTMAIFIASLAFDAEALLDSSKFGILAASTLAALTGLTWGSLALRPPNNDRNQHC